MIKLYTCTLREGSNIPIESNTVTFDLTTYNQRPVVLLAFLNVIESKPNNTLLTACLDAMQLDALIDELQLMRKELKAKIEIQNNTKLTHAYRTEHNTYTDR